MGFITVPGIAKLLLK